MAEPLPAPIVPIHELDHLTQALVRCLADAYRRAAECAEQTEKENAPLAGGARVEVRGHGARASAR